jgi:hypothetical protein
MEVYCGTEARTAKTGDAVFLPRLLPHTYRVQSPMVRFLALMQPAKGIEGYFKGLSQPVSGMDLPTGATPSPPPDFSVSTCAGCSAWSQVFTPTKIADSRFVQEQPQI